jgi:hypothetical protein
MRTGVLVVSVLLLLAAASVHYSDSGNLACGGSETLFVKDTMAPNEEPVRPSPANCERSIVNDLLPTRYSCGHKADIGDWVERELQMLVVKIGQPVHLGR